MDDDVSFKLPSSKCAGVLYNDDRVVAVRGVADVDEGRFGVGAVSSGVRSSSASSANSDAVSSCSSSVDISRFCAGGGLKSSDVDESRPSDVLPRG